MSQPSRPPQPCTEPLTLAGNAPDPISIVGELEPPVAASRADGNCRVASPAAGGMDEQATCHEETAVFPRAVQQQQSPDSWSISDHPNT